MSNEFALFDEYLGDRNSPSTKKIPEIESSCSHEHIINEKDVNICIDCGEEITRIDSGKDWRYYSSNDEKHIADPVRIQTRKIEDKSIYKDVETFGFNENIVDEANKLYLQVTNGSIVRGKTRSGIVFGCIYYVFKISGKPQNPENLMKTFNITPKIASKGMKHVHLRAPKGSNIRTVYTTPEHIINDIMDRFDATKEQKQEVLDLFNRVKNKSSKLNRSKPQSVASAIVYCWIQQKKKNILLKDFAKKVNLSELTISKIAKDVTLLLADS